MRINNYVWENDLSLNDLVLKQKEEIERLREENLLLRASEPMSKLQEDYGYKAEVDRLNNIINELEKRLISDKKFIEDVYKKSHLSKEEFKKQCSYVIGSYDHCVKMINKLQELKGDDK